LSYPVKSEIVSKASDYVYSSAAKYSGILEIELPSNPIIDPLKKGFHMEIEEW
jgi:hypothetical protein